MSQAEAPRRLVAIDLGGTNVRFAIAEVAAGKVLSVGQPVILRSADYDGLAAAWAAYTQATGSPLPRAASLSVAGPVVDGAVQLTNLPWHLDRTELQRALGLDALVIVNDFEAVGHAVAQAGTGDFAFVCGPDEPLPTEGIVSIVGPGTGLGVAMLWRADGDYRVLPSEGGHIGFAPVDTFEDALVAALRARFGRVSAERVVAGPAISDIYDALGGPDSAGGDPAEDSSIWTRGIEGGEPLAREAVERFCEALGSVAGDLALAHGARGVVIAGGVGRRLIGVLPKSGFAERFRDKGRFEARMASLPVKLITHEEPGLLGAAAAFAREAQGTGRPSALPGGE
jgi:glucokinase